MAKKMKLFVDENIAYAKFFFEDVLLNQFPNFFELAFYKDVCYPEHNGLYELPVRVQRNTKLTQQLGWMWWEQICMFSSRDQISFPFVCHQLGIKPTILPGIANTIRGNKLMPQLIVSNHSRVL